MTFNPQNTDKGFCTIDGTVYRKTEADCDLAGGSFSMHNFNTNETPSGSFSQKRLGSSELNENLINPANFNAEITTEFIIDGFFATIWNLFDFKWDDNPAVWGELDLFAEGSIPDTAITVDTLANPTVNLSGDLSAAESFQAKIGTGETSFNNVLTYNLPFIYINDKFHESEYHFTDSETNSDSAGWVSDTKLESEWLVA